MAHPKAQSMAHSKDPLSGLVEDIDRRLPAAYADLTVARNGFARCPSASRRQDCEIAEEILNDLLDLRLALVDDRGLVPAA
jgi:hypothetical protein